MSGVGGDFEALTVAATNSQKVRALVYLLCKVTTQRTFEKELPAVGGDGEAFTVADNFFQKYLN